MKRVLELLFAVPLIVLLVILTSAAAHAGEFNWKKC